MCKQSKLGTRSSQEKPNNKVLPVLTHLLNVLQWDFVLPQLLVDKDERVEVAHTAIQQLIWQLA